MSEFGSKSPRLRPPSTLASAKMRLTAQKVVQMSHMELLCEAARPEPRLRRLLGHVTTYENASHWCQQDQKEHVSFLGNETGQRMEANGVDRGGRYQNAVLETTPTQMHRVWTLSELQATSQSKPEHQRQLTVTEREITEDSDESDESDDSEEIDESDEGDSCSICSDDENPVIEDMEPPQEIISLPYDNDYAIEQLKYRCTTGKQDDDRTLWKQQPRVFSDRESEQAFRDTWL